MADDVLDEAQALVWSGCRNVRDLGGLPARDGRRTRSGALIRADCLDQLAPTGVAAARAVGAALVLDLRSDSELTDCEHPFADDPAYRRIAFIDPVREPERDVEAERTMAEVYRGALDRNGGQIARCVDAIASAGPGPVVVHCFAGKDRTGMLVGLLLELVGVPRTVVAADYALSAARLGFDPASPYALSNQHSRPETITAFLEHLDETWGGPRVYLTMHGVGVAALADVEGRLLEAPRAGLDADG